MKTRHVIIRFAIFWSRKVISPSLDGSGGALWPVNGSNEILERVVPKSSNDGAAVVSNEPFNVRGLTFNEAEFFRPWHCLRLFHRDRLQLEQNRNKFLDAF